MKTLLNLLIPVRKIAMGRLVGGTLMGGIVAFLGACAPADSPDDDPVAMRVGEQEIRLSELQAQLDFLKDRASMAAAGRDVFVERYLERMVALAKARELGLDQDIELRRQWENLLIGRLQQAEMDAALEAVNVTDDAIRTYYEENIERYSQPAQVHLALLFLGNSPRDSEETRAAVRLRMEEARSLAQNLPAETRGFGALAMTYSEEATSRFKGGDVGWIRTGESQYRWPDAVVETGFALSERGTISQVIETDEGFYLLKKLDSRAAVVRPLDDRLSASLQTTLLNEKRAALTVQLKDEWKEGVAVTLHDDVLAALNFSSDPDKREAPAAFSAMP